MNQVHLLVWQDGIGGLSIQAFETEKLRDLAYEDLSYPQCYERWDVPILNDRS